MKTLLIAVMLGFFLFTGIGPQRPTPAPSAATASDAEPASGVAEAPASRYAGKSSGLSMSISNGWEMLLGDASVGKLSRDMAAARDNAKNKGVLTEIMKLPASEATGLVINANLCAVVLEPSPSGYFEIACQGVEDPSSLAVAAEASNGVLTVTAEGTPRDGLYLSASPGWRVNCVRVLAPEGALESLAIDCGEGIVFSFGLALPTVTGVTVRGIVNLRAAGISAPVSLSASSGQLKATADEVSAPVSMRTVNGSAELLAGDASADIALNSANGSVKATVIRHNAGRLDLTAENGAVHAQIGTVGDAAFRADNGSVSLSLGTVLGGVEASVDNGVLDVALKREPTDLTLRLQGGEGRRQRHGHRENLHKWETGFELPDGWYDGMRLGSGEPVLTLSIGSCGRGSLSVSIAE